MISYLILPKWIQEVSIEDCGPIASVQERLRRSLKSQRRYYPLLHDAVTLLGSGLLVVMRCLLHYQYGANASGVVTLPEFKSSSAKRRRAFLSPTSSLAIRFRLTMVRADVKCPGAEKKSSTPCLAQVFVWRRATNLSTGTPNDALRNHGKPCQRPSVDIEEMRGPQGGHQHRKGKKTLHRHGRFDAA